jgi:hypothetical protein
MPISSSRRARQPDIVRDGMMRKRFPPEQYEFFNKLVLAILNLEDALEERERIRWQRDEDWCPDAPSYELLDAQVSEARHAVVGEAIAMAT